MVSIQIQCVKNVTRGNQMDALEKMFSGLIARCVTSGTILIVFLETTLLLND